MEMMLNTGVPSEYMCKKVESKSDFTNMEVLRGICSTKSYAYLYDYIVHCNCLQACFVVLLMCINFNSHLLLFVNTRVPITTKIKKIA